MIRAVGALVRANPDKDQDYYAAQAFKMTMRTRLIPADVPIYDNVMEELGFPKADLTEKGDEFIKAAYGNVNSNFW